jgi:DnaK suppressor protein
MSPDDLAHFQQKLESLVRELEETLATVDSADSSIEPDNAIGRLTRMEAIQAQAMGQEGRRRLSGRLQRAQRAIERLEKGTYGTCTRCGTEIPRGRLEVMPESGLCVTCAARA